MVEDLITKASRHYAAMLTACVLPGNFSISSSDLVKICSHSSSSGIKAEDSCSGGYQWCFMMVGAGLFASVHHRNGPTKKCQTKFPTWIMESGVKLLQLE